MGGQIFSLPLEVFRHFLCVLHQRNSSIKRCSLLFLLLAGVALSSSAADVKKETQKAPQAADNAAWLKSETKRQVAGCRIKSDSGIWLHTPDGIGHYKALWTRDFYYFVK